MTARPYFIRFCLLCSLSLMLMLAAPASHAQISVPQYNQTQGPWAGHILGFSTSGSTIHVYGCGVTCLAMLHRYYGVATDPDDMNNWLKANNVFSGIPEDASREYIVWDNSAGRGVSYAGGVSNPSSNAINAELDSGHPVIVQTLARLRSGRTTMHYVVLTGRTGSTYFINDPVDGMGGTTTFSSRYSVLSYMHKFRGQVGPSPALTTNPVPLLRYYNPSGGDHFYTTDYSEPGAGAGGYKPEVNEGRAFNMQVPGTWQLFRLFNPSTGKHFYTISGAEGDNAVRYGGYHYETGGRIFVFPNNTNPIVGPPYTVPFYRYCNTSDGGHFYTAHDQSFLGTNPYQDYGPWHYEGIQCWILP